MNQIDPSLFDYGLLTYKTKNIGDFIQSLAARRFLPRVDHYIYRDEISSFSPVRATKLICNGWFGASPHNLVFRQGVSPLIISVHVNKHENLSGGGPALPLAMLLRRAPELLQHLASFGPIGARDAGTERLLKELGAQCYFSGCLTLTLERNRELSQGESIVLCDVPAESVARIHRITSRPVEIVSHIMQSPLTCTEAFARAEALLEVYQRARLVITTRLHCALPCVAYGTPVILLEPETEADRFDGLLSFMNVRERHVPFSAAEIEECTRNPDRHLAIREMLMARVKSYLNDPLAAPSLPADVGPVASGSLLRLYAEMAGALRDELFATRSRLASLESSRTWRATAPLRRLGRAFTRQTNPGQ